VRAELGRRGPQQLHEPGLRRRVDALAGLGHGGADGREADDRAAAPRHHARAEGPEHVERGAQVEAHDPVELLARVVQQPLAHVGGGGEHQHVGGDLVGARPDRLGVQHVEQPRRAAALPGGVLRGR
jgi:hypothetical protein